jgi:hypothetical protein
MKIQAGYEPQTYEVSGTELRIHWNIEQKILEDIDGTTKTFWEANEALCDRNDNRNQMIEKIIGSVYSIPEEFATINNRDTKPDEYAAYQALRAQAKSLADGAKSL